MNRAITGIQEILSDLEKRVRDKILEQSNLDLLKKLIENADSLDEAIKIAELGTTYKRTGFHFNKRLERQSNTISYFKKNDTLSFVTRSDTVTHKLIVGDNYPALLNLLIEYKGKIDVIYIDPPYGKDSMGEFAITNYDNAITRDNLLSMLYPRLYVAKQLLSDRGVIFCSIDDRNQAYVKCLFDEIFEESNFIGTYFWKRTETPPSLSHKIRRKFEYVLCYQSQNIPQRRFAQGLVDGGDAPLLNLGNSIGRLIFPIGSVRFNIADGFYCHKPNHRIELLNQLEVKNGLNATPIEAKGNFKWGQNNLDDEIETGTYFLIKSNEFSIRYQKPEKATKIPSNVIDMAEVEVGTNETAAKELSDAGFGGDFYYAKPVSLIKYLIKMGFWEDDSIKVLDFFAGSGTTGQAVLELNSEDGGQRQFILATNNEITPTTPNGVVIDVTSRRLKRIMTGKCYDGTSDFDWAKKNTPLGDNLEVLDIAEVSNFEAVAGQTAFDVIDETLYGSEKFKDVKEKVEWVCNNFEVTQKRLEE